MLKAAFHEDQPVSHTWDRLEGQEWAGRAYEQKHRYGGPRIGAQELSSGGRRGNGAGANVTDTAKGNW